MIAENVTVNILGEICDGLYSGCASGNSFVGKRAYFITSDKAVNETVNGIVTAVAEFDGMSDERLVVAPYGEIYYEPELREILSNLRNVALRKITCLYEKSCGAVVFYKNRRDTKLLLVKNNNGRYWSFPKGHIEQGEDERKTALREIKEETGLDVTFVEDFRNVSEYCPYGRIRKRVVFFLARAFTDNVHIQEEEIESYVWVDFQQARKLCTYENDLKIIEKAETAIHLMKS